MSLDDAGLLDSFGLSGDGLPDPLPEEPMGLFEAWFREAHEKAIQPNPNAMTLATADDRGHPSARIVLCKGIEPDAGAIVFYTNRESRKGRELESGRAAAVFHWDPLDRQVRIEGRVTRVSDAESDAYFASRHWQSRIGAWASRQSQPLASREQLLEQVGEVILELNLDLGALLNGDPVDIPRPPHWGGYRLWADALELWVGGSGRIHDRAVWTRGLPDTLIESAVRANTWSGTRLQP